MKRKRCTKCKGTGIRRLPGTGIINCDQCKGRGWIEEPG